MDQKIIVLATHNAGKIRELQEILTPLGYSAVPVRTLLPDIEEPEETGQTFAENARIKARFYAKQTGCACLADDSGLEVDALGGAPGVYSARFAGENADDEANNKKLCRELEALGCLESQGRYRCVLAFVDEAGQELLSDGVCEGLVRTNAAGSEGFGYDPYFFVPELGCTMAQLHLEEKKQISHRGVALRAMSARLAGYLK